MQRCFAAVALAGLLVILACCQPLMADDWPAFRHDNRRSGQTEEQLALPLELAWTRSSTNAPVPAWPGPATQNPFGRHFYLNPVDEGDKAFEPVVVGDYLYYGSSSTDTLYCVDRKTGETVWSFTTEGPIRLAPAVADGKLYLGSDDGLVYCLDANTGKLDWKYRPGPEDQRLPGNGRMISRWPVRCGMVVDEGMLYFAAGVFPTAGVYLCCLDAQTGREVWKEPIDVPARDYLAASPTRLYVRGGRSGHHVYRRKNGQDVGNFGGGGAFAILVGEQLVTGPSETGEVTGLDSRVKEKIASVRGLQLVVRSDQYFASTHDALVAIDAQRNLRWKVAREKNHALIMAGDALLVGGDGEVTAYDADDGQQLWQAPVDGQARALAVASGCLFVSTDKGTIHCFASAETSPRNLQARDVAAQPQPFPLDELSDRYREAAEGIIARSGATQGYCLVLDSGEGRLAYELAQISDLRIIGIERDAAKVARSRASLLRAGLYGDRVVIHHLDSADLPYQHTSLNLVVSDGLLHSGAPPTASARRVWNVVRPYGGAVVFAAPATAAGPALTEWGAEALPDWQTEKEGPLVWAVARRGELPGAGQWSHQYADPGNTACSRDALVDDPVEVQWFGLPGPEHMVDRHNRTSSPVFVDGRVFISGNDYMIAADAYNGTILWQREVPDSVRLIVSKDCSNLAAAADAVYIASGHDCLALDPKTGETKQTFAIGQFDDKLARRWAYVATSDGLLFGSAARDEEARRTVTPDSWSLGYLDNAALVCSDELYGFDRHTARRLWAYRPKSGVVINASIAVDDGRIYFVESTNPETQTVESGRMRLDVLLGKGATLVALNARSGDVVWSQPLDLRELQHTLFLAATQGVVLVSGSKNVGVVMRYEMQAFDAKTGKMLWNVTPPVDQQVGGSHGEQDQHPAIVGDVIFSRTFAYDLHTGEKKRAWQVPGGGCGPLATCESSAFFRAGSPMMTNLTTGYSQLLTKVTRPGCWINIIPAGGLILAPEGSAGCTCSYGLQTSFALRPVGCDPPAILATGESNTYVGQPSEDDNHFAVKMTCELSSPQPGAVIHYTTDGSWPSLTAPRYQRPIELDRTTTVRARAYLPDGIRSPVAARTFTPTDVPRFVTRSQPFVVTARVELAHPHGVADVRYTLDGTAPATDSPIYKGPFEVESTTTVTAALFHAGKRVGEERAEVFERVAGRRAVERDDLVSGIDYEYYEGDLWRKLPDFDAMTPVSTGTLDTISLTPARRDDAFGLRYTGFLKVPKDGFYIFYLRSDDGSKFYLGDRVLISNDGVHDARRQGRAQVALAAGFHPIKVEFFENAGDNVLEVRYEGPNIPRQTIPASALYHPKPVD